MGAALGQHGVGMLVVDDAQAHLFWGAGKFKGKKRPGPIPRLFLAIFIREFKPLAGKFPAPREQGVLLERQQFRFLTTRGTQARLEMRIIITENNN
jgi:hypothetical protein